MQYWFTSDWHIDHKKIMLIRPFNDVNVMNDLILHNLFTNVKRGDVLYFLGDMSFSRKTIEEILIKLKRHGIQVIIIKGNHDKYPSYTPIYLYRDIKIYNTPITLCHFPMFCWEKSHYGAWHLHGHIHNVPVPDYYTGKIYNVCVDQNDYTPLNYDQIKEIMDNKPNNWDYLTKGLDRYGKKEETRK